MGSCERTVIGLESRVIKHFVAIFRIHPPPPPPHGKSPVAIGSLEILERTSLEKQLGPQLLPVHTDLFEIR